MNFSIKTKRVKLIIFCWKSVFHQEPSLGVIRQAERFFLFGTGMMVARFLSVASQVIMGRKFGPEIYGQITIILLISSYFAMPIVNGWGLVFTKIAVKEIDVSKKNQALKSLLLVVSVCCILTTLVLFVLQSPLADLLDIDRRMMRLSLIMTVCYAWWILTKQIAQGFQNWRAYILIENIWASIVLSGLLVLAFWGKFNLFTVSWVFFAGYVVAGLVLVKGLWQSLLVKIDKNYIKDILSHGWFLLLNSIVGTAAFSVDRIMINKALGSQEVGIYQAHFIATYGMTSAIFTVFITYIFPIICRNNTNTVSLLEKIAFLQYPATILFTAATGYFSFSLFSYQFNSILFIFLVMFCAIQNHLQINLWYIASKGIDGGKKTLISQAVFFLSSTVILIVILPYCKTYSGGIALAVSSLITLIFSGEKKGL
ncbi:MAG: Membrane protein involved in the export of O-antigen and teichoic acid [Candidatus Electronema aureum]|uniref:Membrane protein involved in the export of O-antigen and teichoic acid n=1 Tax=Candidatus Electronema aureum TaxID=2005002 RepID=A0A521G084_9BACT|nr:MAG: Membrane protein involved in the export of O-antigen and teichoic acid [Candidatus Electronema aureum]